MTMTILHILNGDSTAHVFNQSGIGGEVAVWLIRIDGPTELPRYGQASSPDAVRQYHCTITSEGLAVLAGRMDHVEINGIDRWLGGIRLVGKNVWRWNAGGAELIRR